jgi:hypothetical protein
MSALVDGSGGLQSERRKLTNLRDIFDDVVQLVEPFFLHGAGLNGRPTEYWAARAIGEAYADLSSQEVQILTSAAARYCREHGVGKIPV